MPRKTHSADRGNEKQHRYAKKKYRRRKERIKENRKNAAPSQRRRMCSEKVRYPSFTTAMTVACRRMQEAGVQLRPYRCPLCDGYHLTSKAEYGSHEENF